ncbi:type I glyceraldehyde-3-phosphate dehydrogenase [Acinetobacter radioresistens]|jgi:glyceraldehyde 3-phosphate dehydrogenase|uniref:Aldehyde dehydrogenase n=2 Tax=Acinetobacter radioresistens TaxID=40216 RepID=A0A2T1IXI9_ACIRA|nr:MULTISPECIES: type I glyceraldehyde-3-phosphate dehydrogenase [Acinetobacter]AWV85884.1 aldehyde dehydrogenase [Acinetobacter radioresistens]EET82486.1 glyceraldehyde 3-phosphate dehydrogenase domain protein [Acinetobacter radioresistens SK82]EEY87739.1 glyceraldehyde 3-phosphate dehydrogenase domain protein [Acinetobacter radioresistens SH164]ENV88064.1 glyceraldehyde-3-phosphate dehydrogenase, type I [Acinetobacter radioresistens NIPH 2130]ENV88697.1 glyceraldehyde-3-phosphate dehydrogena
MQRVAINGFGRIGRNVLRAWFENPKAFNFDIVAINDIADVETLVHLFRYDTTHGRFAGNVEISQKNEQIVLNISAGTKTLNVRVLNIAEPAALPWQQLNVDVVLECTGLFRSREAATRHIKAGAKRVIIGAAPFDTVDAAIVYGVNHHEIKASDQIISSVSCTTQALVPLVKIIDDAFGIDTAMMTEIHAVTADQTVLDKAHRDLRRARASGQNIIPTTSSALGALKRVMPKMENRIEGYSIRVPTINVAAIDLTFISHTPITVHKINEVLIKSAQYDYAQIMAVTDEPLVSSDFNHSPYSLIVDLSQTLVVGHQAKVFAWYDNEWGYANRLLDLCQSFE